MKVPLDAQHLHLLSDGFTGRILDSAFAEVCKDLEQRGHDGQPRKIDLSMSFKKKDGAIIIEPQVKTTLPPQRPPVTVAKYSDHAGGILFNPDVPANPDQGTFADVRGEAEE